MPSTSPENVAATTERVHACVVRVWVCAVACDAIQSFPSKHVSVKKRDQKINDVSRWAETFLRPFNALLILLNFLWPFNALVLS